MVLFASLLLTHFSACAQVKDLGNRLTAYNKINLATLNTDILKLVNEHRASIGLPTLQMLAIISTEAQQHSADMVQGSTPFGHDGFETRAAHIKKPVGFIYGVAENVAYGQMTAEEVVNGWLHSPGHKKNIEGDYNFTGIGTVQREDGVIYFTLLFVRK